ncbi:MAG TPA: hypothetical protein VLF79_04325, partial [Candidatus Saccharimonadales bacterium]|nr:hypothetical protein [Candidatus Saccharimonadales bacterium]
SKSKINTYKTTDLHDPISLQKRAVSHSLRTISAKYFTKMGGFVVRAPAIEMHSTNVGCIILFYRLC